MGSIHIAHGQVVNEGTIRQADIYIEDRYIAEIAPRIQRRADTYLDASGCYVFPGLVDTHVHFREPGFTYKGDIATESRAAVAGGVTSFMEMPNTKPPTTSLERLEDKLQRAKACSWANYGFYIGATCDNIAELPRAREKACGVKVFMGSSTGNMLVDDPEVLRRIFTEANMLVAVHCEDEALVQAGLREHRARYGTAIPMAAHSAIRSREACYRSTCEALDLARACDTRLHILHVSTKEEAALFEAGGVDKKRITGEACAHHLCFTQEDYAGQGGCVKINPSLKTKKDREALWQALAEGRLDTVGSDHAPHTLKEKESDYLHCPSGAPMVQHMISVLIGAYGEGKLSLEKVVEKACHHPARCYGVEKRGFLREGYFADLAVVDIAASARLRKDALLSRCGWSPLGRRVLRGRVLHTVVSGHLAYTEGAFRSFAGAMPLTFSRA